MSVRIIDSALLDAVSAEARSNPRGRRNRNFHPGDDFPAQRLLNAVEPGSYVMPHRHLDLNKDETMLVLRGSLGLICFDDTGNIIERARLGPTANGIGVDIPHGVYHTVLALETGTVFFEAKAGPYQALSADERAPWAPAEGSPAAVEYYAELKRRCFD